MKTRDTKKVYVLDTSVLINDPEVLDRLGSNIIVVPIWVVEKLGQLALDKHEYVATGAREASYVLEQYIRKGGSSFPGRVTTNSDGELYIDTGGNDLTKIAVDLRENKDNRIIVVAIEWQKRDRGEVILLSSDANMRIKAASHRVRAEPYFYDRKLSRIEDLYTGLETIQLGQENAHLLGEIARNKHLEVDQLSGIYDPKELIYNQCCIIAAGDKMQLGIWKGDHFVRVDKWKEKTSGNGGYPCNLYQSFAYHMAMDPSVEILTLIGSAGSGKTLMALLAGYHQLGDGRSGYKSIKVFRPTWEIGKELGFLKGTEEQKFAPWKRPIYDALEVILDGNQVTKSDDHRSKEIGRFKTIESLEAAGLLSIEPINYILGRTLSGEFVIIDESQNFTHREMRAILTRMGDGTKVVLTGDVNQVANPYVDSLSNGLSCTIESCRQKMKKENIRLFGHIAMPKVERSRIAELVEKIF
jgi:PhoH-like ATPase